MIQDNVLVIADRRLETAACSSLALTSATANINNIIEKYFRTLLASHWFSLFYTYSVALHKHIITNSMILRHSKRTFAS